MALDCGREREAERLIATALSGNPPGEIAEELRDLLEQVNFQRHLRLHNIQLEPNEVQVSLAGNAIATGLAPNEVFINRLRDLERLLFRTVERISGAPFRERGQASKGIQSTYSLFTSVPRPASFAVTLRLGKQSQLPGLDDSPRVIQEIIDCLRLFDAVDDKKLHERIRDDAYYTNFIGLAKRIAPDGEQVNVVGLTTIQDNQEIKVAIQRRRSEWQAKTAKLEKKKREKKIVKVTGRLLFADGLKGHKRIQIVDEVSGDAYNIVVPEGMMTDIVRPLLEEVVNVTGQLKGKTIKLQEIERVGE